MAARRETDSEAIRRYLDGIGRYPLLTAEGEVQRTLMGSAAQAAADADAGDGFLALCRGGAGG